MRVALYARVSTRDKDQNPQNQLVLLRREVEHAGDTVIKEYIDEESGGKTSRKQFQQSMHDAEKRKFDLVQVFALDRFSIEGIEAVFEHSTNVGWPSGATASPCLIPQVQWLPYMKLSSHGPLDTATSATARTCA